MNREQIVTHLRDGEIDFLRFVWTDNGNMIRAKALFLPAFLAYYQEADGDAVLEALEGAVTISAAMLSVPATLDVPAPRAGLAPVRDIRLLPAWDSFVIAAVPPRSATVICELVEEQTPWNHCPRAFLRRMIDRLAGHGLSLHIGLELEFYLLRPPAPGEAPRPVDRASYAHSLATQISQGVIGEMVRALWAQGIPVEQYVPEGGPGQQEITLEHCAPMLLADRLVHARETLHGVALANDLIASFLPVVFEGGAGSGLHTHMSLWRDGRNHTAGPGQPYGLTPQTNAFLAGVLHHLPALMAVTTPTRNSYRRIRPHAWSGAYQAWGIANKEAALRLIVDARQGGPGNIELKTMDATANPYLALGAIIAAGLDGLAREMHLPEPAEIDPGDYSGAERARLGIAALPAAPETALRAFVQDMALVEAMGERMAEVYTAVRQAELDSLADVDFAGERDLLLQRY
jgi:glutamine synthetase